MLRACAPDPQVPFLAENESEAGVMGFGGSWQVKAQSTKFMSYLLLCSQKTLSLRGLGQEFQDMWKAGGGDAFEQAGVRDPRQ